MEMKIVMKEGQERTFALLEYYTAYVGTYLPAFWDSKSVTSWSPKRMVGSIILCAFEDTDKVNP